jgi:quinol monooxygenase YgiN
MVEMDKTEPGTIAYILAKSHDGSTYYFLVLFQDQAAIDFHSKAPHFKEMNKKMVPAIKGAPGGKRDFSLTGMAVCGSTPRKPSAAAILSKL